MHGAIAEAGIQQISHLFGAFYTLVMGARDATCPVETTCNNLPEYPRIPALLHQSTPL